MPNILDIFYNHIIKEAANGRINCLSYFNILFFTNIIGTNTVIQNPNANTDNLYIPTLMIKDKEEFDKQLIEYVLNALKFYDDNNFEYEILDYKEYNEETKICKEKVILTLLWSNATVEDFNNPIEYVKRQTEFMKNNLETQEDLGYSETLQGNITVQIKKDRIMNETPYKLDVSVNSDDNLIYQFPSIKFGIHDNKLYIYAIQNKATEENQYGKKIKRQLYKVNENFNKDIDNYQIYDDGNLADITPSFLIAANIAIFYLKKYNIDEIIIPSILIERWNAKKLALHSRAKKKENKEEFIKERLEKEDEIQNNITQKLIRTFLRLKYHHQTIDVTSYPMENDSSLHITLTNENINCNNKLLEETALLSIKHQIKR